jgi:hypothetical protein
MPVAILDRLTYISVMIYLLYILAEGWNRLTPVY